MVIGFDFDGTLVRSFTSDPLPGVRAQLAALPSGARTFVATNQAGPEHRAGLGSSKYPTADAVAAQLVAGLDAVGLVPQLVLICVAPPQERWPAWQSIARAARNELQAALVGPLAERGVQRLMMFGSSFWRKPQPAMLLEAARWFRLAPAEVVYVGDMESDREAAAAAGCRFVEAGAWRAGFAISLDNQIII